MHLIRKFAGPVSWLAAMVFAIPAAQAAEPVVVIAAFNLTGPEAALDAPCYKGAELAAATLNEAGGVLGRPISLVPVDTASDTGSTTDKVAQALKAHPNAVAGIGFTDSTFALDAGRVFQKAKIPFITPGATAPDLPQTVGSDMFLASYGDDAQAEVMASYAWNELKIRRVALWVDNSRLFTRTVGGFFEVSFRKLGGTVDRQEFGTEATDFSALIAAYQAADPRLEAIYAASMPETAVPLIRKVREAGIGVPLLSADGWADEDIVAASKSEGIGGIYFSTHRFLGVDTPAMKAFAAAYKEKYGSAPPNSFAALGFDSVNLLAAAIERAGSASPDSVRAALAGTRDFQGVAGKIAYAPGKRVPGKAVAIIRIDDGVETPVWTWTPPQH